MTAASEPNPVWLRGNVRPAVAIALMTAAASGLALVGLAVAGGSGASLRAALAAAAVLVLAALALVAVASRPRLERRGDAVRVRLAPLVAHDVPLDVVECVFLGSSPLGPDAAAVPDRPTRRVGTLVMRLAERAVEWRKRPTFPSWGTWEDGHIVFDGRWCEPLSLEAARRVSQLLLEAKREAALATRGDSAPGAGA